jgi:hypothetical protein
LRADDRQQIDVLRQEFFGDARRASTPVELRGLAAPGPISRSRQLL